MKKFGILLSVLLILTMMSTSISNATPNHTSEEIIEIVLADPYVDEWIKSNDGIVEEPVLNDTIWIVMIYSQNSDYSSYLAIIVDDSTGEINDILEYEDNSTYPSNSLVDDAVAYFKELEMVQHISSSYPNLEFYGYYSHDNLISIYGYTSWDEYNESNNINIWGYVEFSENNSGKTTFDLVLVSANRDFGTPNHNFSTIQTTVEENSDVQEFTSTYENYTVQIQELYINQTNDLTGYNLTQGYYYGLYYFTGYGGFDMITDEAQSATMMEDVRGYGYCYDYAWLSIVVSDSTETILEIAGTTTAILTKTEVEDIILADQEFADWLEGIDSYTICSNFDGYDTWWVNINTDSVDWGYALVNDTSSEIEDYYIFEAVPSIHSENEIIDLALQNPEISQWIESVDSYQIYTYYDYQGQWYVYLYDTVVYNQYAYATVNDTTEEIYNVYTHLVEPPNLEIEDIHNILRTVDFEEFLDLFPNARVSIYYDGYDTWYVYVYSPVVVNAYVYLQIDDNSGEIIYHDQYIPDSLPTKTLDDIETIINDLEYYTNFTSTHEIIYEYSYFLDGNWTIFVEGITDDGQYEYIIIRIDDQSGEVISFDLYDDYWYYVADSFGRDEALANPEVVVGGEQRSNREGESLAEILNEEGNTSSPDLTLNFPYIMLVTIFVIPIIHQKRKTIR